MHELLLHTSTAEMVELVVAFARDGVAAAEPTLLAVRPEIATVVRDTVEPAPHLAVLPPVGQPGRPASDLRATDALLAGYMATAPRVRILNQEPTVPPDRTGTNGAASKRWSTSPWPTTTRGPYASTTGHALTANQADDLCATHPLLWSEGQHRPNDGYQDPVKFIRKHKATPPDPVEHTAPRGGTDRSVPGRRP